MYGFHVCWFVFKFYFHNNKNKSDISDFILFTKTCYDFKYTNNFYGIKSILGWFNKNYKENKKS